MEEIWKDIDGYGGAYKISNLGNVYSVYKKGILKPGTGSQGHRYVSLYKDRKSKSYNVHRLVGEYFIPNPENKPFVCHKVAISNGGSDSVDNLYWGTREENDLDKARDGNHAKAMLETRGKAVVQMDLDGNFIARYPSMAEAAKAVGGVKQGICGCCNKKPRHKTAYGYKWKFEDER